MPVGGVERHKGEWVIFTKSGRYHPPGLSQLWISEEIGSEEMFSLLHNEEAKFCDRNWSEAGLFREVQVLGSNVPFFNLVTHRISSDT